MSSATCPVPTPSNSERRTAGHPSDPLPAPVGPSGPPFGSAAGVCPSGWTLGAFGGGAEPR
eukprot:10928542-Alexandrium_andersonii.AAC.1